jgi:site-specific DNA-methyltransferase (adenine-specific)
MKSEVFNRDCLEAMREMPDKAFDLCLTDPPYGVNLEYGTYQDTPENWYALMADFIPEAQRVAKMVIMPSCRINALKWLYSHFSPDWLIVWHKGSPGCSAYVGFNDYEPHLVFGKTSSRLQMHDHFTVVPDVKMGSFGHPCPKPLAWARWLMKRALPHGGSVVDPFLGSGTTRIAAYDLGFDFTGYELDKDYFEAQERRFADHIAQPKLFVPEQAEATQGSLLS